MTKFMERLLGSHTWKDRWQDELTQAIQDAQKGLAVNMVMIVARESDIYSELLFILSFLGLSLGALASYFCLNLGWRTEDLLIMPLSGFALGATLYTLRRFYIHKVAPRAVKERVAQKAKAQFFDHSHNLSGKLALIYFSELEREALFLTSVEITPYLNNQEIQKALSLLLINYNVRDPLKSIRPALLQLGDSLRTHLPAQLAPLDPENSGGSMIYLGAHDRVPHKLRIPILKGSKDIN